MASWAGYSRPLRTSELLFLFIDDFRVDDVALPRLRTLRTRGTGTF